MTSNEDRRIVMVTRKTRLEELVERFNTWPQTQFYLEHNGIDSREYLQEHDLYQTRLIEAEQVLRPLGRFQRLERGFLPSYQFSEMDIVVIIGQDGLVANTLKYLKGQPVIAVNPDPSRFDGILLPFAIEDLAAVTKQCLGKGGDFRSITFAQAKTNDGQSMLAVNDLFIGPRSHTSARYKMDWNDHRETQSSSGIIVSTGLGSSGWLQSILAGAMGVTGLTEHPMAGGFAWEEKRLQFSVREPFPSRTSSTDQVFGSITPDNSMRLESMMPENGVIFSDGIEEDYLHFNSGTVVEIGIADTQGMLVIS
jgi:NAD kinase